MRAIIITDYDSQWPSMFLQLRAPIWDAVKKFVVSVEHVGGTSVPGLSAKPVIDMSVVVSPSTEFLLDILRESGFSIDDLAEIESANRK
jgi:GrpB-like predicted nucleotidyltransferase (UPF0157 family)